MIDRRLALPAVIALPALALAGCATASSGETGDGGDAFRIVASTSVYASLAEQLVGDAAEVTAIIDSPTQDPHSYEATARDQLAVDGADIAILNGGGYDHFMEELVEAAGTEHVLTAVEFSHAYPGNEGHEEGDGHDHSAEAEEEHDHAEEEEGASHEGHDHIEGFNEHVWYDPHTIAHVVEDLAGELEELLPDAASDIAAAEEALVADIEGLEASLDEISTAHAGSHVFFTEPIGGYLAEAAGLEDVTTDGFAEAVEEGQDVAPATLLAATEAIEGGEVDVVVANAQTGGAETSRIIETAEAAGVPVVEYAETLPEGQTYVEWMADNIAALGDALEG
ncbi:ABC transporter substrate-binding protein [Microbacterium barkeri]|uniref:ABC transporter substrate-binding protein n=1 Tax=Microbacterium barkeri TaxID=33917 RepID=A0A9W6LW20_9MICO|nr:zinc ABC transporter substrate-binding protein [Microbacterium barkeri]MDI6942925.1 zinc ABC transporter substrate-binding protein [Microbacterium barkeri]MDR6877770.1 zinc/manganese transport system substrate-binding protein [Microbacterium barkeri]GLJ60926.1 ABC transporter substrate-binding protein [Microbacterium barkeri]